MSPFRSIADLSFEHVWRACPFRSVFAAVPPTAPMPRVGSAVVVNDDPECIAREDAFTWANMAEEGAKHGCCFVILARAAAARDRAKMLLTEELERRHAERIAQCGTTLAEWARCEP